MGMTKGTKSSQDNAVKGFPTLPDPVHVTIIIMCYFCCHGNDVKGFSALLSALLTMKPLANTCHEQQIFSSCVVLDVLYG
jgi:hypothetical protein